MNKYIIMIAAILIAACIFTACSRKSGSKGSPDTTVYKYDDPKQCGEIKITKSVYENGKLKIYLDCSYLEKGISSLECFDENNNPLDEYDNYPKYSYEDGVLKIRHPDAEKIAGITISTDGDMRFALRGLNTKQFAGLYYIFAYDIGYIEQGDAEAYYTEEERRAATEADAQAKSESLDAFSLLEGHWVEEYGKSYMDIYEVPEYGCYALDTHFFDASGEEDGYETYIQSFSYYRVNGTNNYEISGSTGETTAPVFFTLTEDRSILHIGWYDGSFLREQS